MFRGRRRRLLATEGPDQWRLLRDLCGEVVELRRGDHSARHLGLERTRLAAIEHRLKITSPPRRIFAPASWTIEAPLTILRPPVTLRSPPSL